MVQMLVNQLRPYAHVGDVVLFLKSEKEFDKQYQYVIIVYGKQRQ